MPRYSSNPPGSIKSIQYGTLFMATTEDYTEYNVTAVDLTKSVLHFLGCAAFTGGAIADGRIYIYMLDSDTVAAQRYKAGSVAGYVSWRLVEYY